jgi:hypothetical protein
VSIPSTREHEDSIESSIAMSGLSLFSEKFDRVHNRSNSFEDFTKVFNELMETANKASHGGSSTDFFKKNNDSFLDEVIAHLEAKKIPFEHVDVWVPS